MANSINKNTNISSSNNCTNIKPFTKFNNINLFPQQAGNFLELMPTNYIYNLLKWNINEKESNFTFEVDLSSEEEFQIWFEAFKIKSCSQFNVRTSKKGEGKFMLLRTLYKCIHNVHGGILGKRKHTGCPTQLKVTIYPSQKKQFLLVNERRVGMCKMQLLWNHNHPLYAADALKSQMEKRLLELYNKGHNPTTARQKLLTEAEVNGKDSSIVPDYKRIYYVFKKLKTKEYDVTLTDSSNNMKDIANEYNRATMDEELNNLSNKDNNICNTNHFMISNNSCMESTHSTHKNLNEVTSNINLKLEDENEIVFVPFQITNDKLSELNPLIGHQQMQNVAMNPINNFESMSGIMNILKSEAIRNFQRLIGLSLINPDSIDVLTKLCKYLQNIKSRRAAIRFLRKITTKRKAHKYKRLKNL